MTTRTNGTVYLCSDLAVVHPSVQPPVEGKHVHCFCQERAEGIWSRCCRCARLSVDVYGDGRIMPKATPTTPPSPSPGEMK